MSNVGIVMDLVLLVQIQRVCVIYKFKCNGIYRNLLNSLAFAANEQLSFPAWIEFDLVVAFLLFEFTQTIECIEANRMRLKLFCRRIKQGTM